MFFKLIILLLFLLFLTLKFITLRRIRHNNYKKRESLSRECGTLKKKEEGLLKQAAALESNLSEHFLFYDIARKIAPILDKGELFNLFSEELKCLGPIHNIELSDTVKGHDYLRFALTEKDDEAVYLKTESKVVIRYMPYFAKLLSLCFQRIKFYNKLQELSIQDSLTKIYNRRYFMLRYSEEFQRAKKFNLNLSFLMIDVDHFKKINDTYGHLVGDAVLREVALIIQESIREIDFTARYGGEEFSVILPDTDKAGAIMVAERINSKISQKPIQVFDEALGVNISVGVGSFPQNTIHPDVLVEVADKALYKAKISGRDRVCWF